MARFKQFSFKKFGYFDFATESNHLLYQPEFKNFVKIAFVRSGAKIVLDFQEYYSEKDAIYFINGGQVYQFDETTSGTIIYYNRDFYCVEIHDAEVACDGLLFHNIYEIPRILMDGATSEEIYKIINEIKTEFDELDSNSEEMLRLLLKKIIIKSVRIWKSENKIISESTRKDVEFSRGFSQLVEWNFHKLHTVGAYSDLLKITPETLNKRITKQHGCAPNELIKKRIILEAKRLLAHTSLTVKEIGYRLGYDDPSYFVRLFSNQVKTSPQSFRLKYQSSNP